MKIGGRGLREHIRFLAPLFGLIVAVWLLRLIADAAVPNHRVARFFSVTAAAALSVLLAVLMIHVRRFGGYANVVVASLLLVTWAQLLIVAAIVFSVVTGIQNVFSAPEYSGPGPDPYHLRHIRGHLTYGIGMIGLMAVVVACLLLFLLRVLVPDRSRDRDSQTGIN